MTWMPGPDYTEWHAPDDFQAGTYASEWANKWADYLVEASPQAFADLDGALSALASLCDIVAPALRNAEQSEWYGDAKDQFVAAVGHFPSFLNTIASQLKSGRGYLQEFSDVTFTQQSRFSAAVEELGKLPSQYQDAVHPTAPYASKEDGLAIIQPMQTKIADCYAQMYDAIKASTAGLEQFQYQMAGLVAPQQTDFSITAFLENAISQVGKDALGTPGALLALFEHPSLKTLETFTEDVAVDATALAALLTGGAAAAALSGLDAGLDAAVVLDETGDYFSSVAFRSSIASSADDFAEGNIGAGLVGAIFVAWGYHASGGAESALNEVAALNDYNQALKAGTVADLSPQDQELLAQLFPNGVSEQAATNLTNELTEKLQDATTDAGMDSLKDFLRQTFGEAPAKQTA